MAFNRFRYDTEAVLRLREHLQGLISQGRLQAASFLISLDNRVIAREALGDSGVKGIPFSTDAIRPVQSIVKTITALAALQLVEQGKLKLDDSIARYLSAFNRTGFRLITLRHLLTHRSGLRADATLFGSDDHANWLSRLTGVALAAEPGTEFDYSNCGFAILGSVIAQVSGSSYEQYVQERILVPLDMTMTSFRLPAEQLPLLSLVHQREENAVDPPIHRSGVIPRSFGGLFSTLGDLSKLAHILLHQGDYGGRRILGESYVRMMTTEGLGLFLDGSEIGTLSSRTYSHHGAGWTALTVDPEHRLTAVLFVPSIESYVAEALHPSMHIIGSGIRRQ